MNSKPSKNAQSPRAKWRTKSTGGSDEKVKAADPAAAQKADVPAAPEGKGEAGDRKVAKPKAKPKARKPAKKPVTKKRAPAKPVVPPEPAKAQVEVETPPPKPERAQSPHRAALKVLNRKRRADDERKRKLQHNLLVRRAARQRGADGSGGTR